MKVLFLNGPVKGEIHDIHVNKIITGTDDFFGVVRGPSDLGATLTYRVGKITYGGKTFNVGSAISNRTVSQEFHRAIANGIVSLEDIELAVVD